MGAPTADAPIISRKEVKELVKMKRFLGILFAVAAVTVCMVSCHKVVRADVRALVDEINDTVMVAKIGDSKVKFDIRQARFTNGAVMYGDSVIVNYIGDLSMKRAFAESIWLIERPGNIIVVDHNAPDTVKEVMTRPADPERDAKGLKNAQRFARQMKKINSKK